VVRFLLQRFGQGLNQRDIRGTTPLMDAVRAELSHIEPMIKLLVEHDADVNAQDRDGRTVLHHLVARQCEGLDSVNRFLVDAGARVLKDKVGRDPCDLCMSPGARAILHQARLNPNPPKLVDEPTMLLLTKLEKASHDR